MTQPYAGVAPGRWDPAVFVAAPRSTVFGYFADPENRPEWQASLARVTLIDPNPPHHGQRWKDHLRGGPSFELQTIAMDDGSVWAEIVTTGPFTAIVTLLFEDAERDGVPGTLVRCVPRVMARGVLRPLAWAGSAVMALLARNDLRRAAGIVGK
jgi:hypothetical protein